MEKILVLADLQQDQLVFETKAALKDRVTVLELGGAHDEDLLKSCDLTLIINAYTDGVTMKVADILIGLDKIILAYPSDPWKYSGKGANFLIQTGNARMVTCADDIFSYLTPVISSKSETGNSRVAHKG